MITIERKKMQHFQTEKKTAYEDQIKTQSIHTYIQSIHMICIYKIISITAKCSTIKTYLIV